MTFPQALTPVTFAPGQRLLAADLDAAVAYELRLLAAHVRLAHGVWGVASGLEVVPGDGGAVRVTAGLAYDVYGRALRLREDRPVSCQEREAVVLCPRVAGDTGWPACRSADAVRTGVDIVLDPGGTGLDRRGAPAMSNRYLAAGSRRLDPSEAGSWTLPRANGTAYLGFDFDVSIGEATFTSVPCYFATLRREEPDDPAAPPLLASVAAPTRVGFRLQVVFAGPGAAPRTLAAAAAALGPTTVQWLAVEP